MSIQLDKFKRLKTINIFMEINMNQKFYDVLMNSAFLWANLSTCNRRKVGCVITKDSRILATGYNGTISGMDNCCEEIEKIMVQPCPKCNEKTKTTQTVCSKPKNDEFCTICNGTNTKKVPKFKTKDSVLHAEQNALMFALKNGISTKNTTLYCTDAPCVVCAKLIAQAGITQVFYNRTYRDTKGIDLLLAAKVSVHQLGKN
jgi:dCMP deaminase